MLQQHFSFFIHVRRLSLSNKGTPRPGGSSGTEADKEPNPASKEWTWKDLVALSPRVPSHLLRPTVSRPIDSASSSSSNTSDLPFIPHSNSFQPNFPLSPPRSRHRTSTPVFDVLSASLPFGAFSRLRSEDKAPAKEKGEKTNTKLKKASSRMEREGFFQAARSSLSPSLWLPSGLRQISGLVWDSLSGHIRDKADCESSSTPDSEGEDDEESNNAADEGGRRWQDGLDHGSLGQFGGQSELTDLTNGQSVERRRAAEEKKKSTGVAKSAENTRYGSLARKNSMKSIDALLSEDPPLALSSVSFSEHSSHSSVSSSNSFPASPSSPSFKVLASISTPLEWSYLEVADWLERLGMAEHSQAFAKHSVDGRLLLHLNDEDLRVELGKKYERVCPMALLLFYVRIPFCSLCFLHCIEHNRSIFRSKWRKKEE